MDFDISDEQNMLADSARRMIADLSPPSRLRQIATEKESWDAPLWAALGKMGYLGTAIAESDGGLGLTDLDLALVSQELGRAAGALPFLSSIGMAAEAIALGGSPAQRAKWLPKLADGSTIAAFAYAEGQEDIWSAPPRATFADGTVSGMKWPVADLAVAHIAIIACQRGGKPILVIVDLAQAGVTRHALQSIDPLRPLGKLEMDKAAADPLDGADAQVIDRLFDRMAMLIAFEQIGGAEACLDMALSYAAERRIFGRSLASYQAIKHILADVYVAIELARSNAYFAAWAATTNADERSEAAAIARLSALEAYEMAARENLQVHGGIGYTWEADCHFHYRRERLQCAMLGGRARWANRLIDVMPALQRAA